jgi:hypothetical protein
MGYPYNLDFDYGPLEGLQRFMINNLGDPFIESNYGVHSREFEVGVLHWCAVGWWGGGAVVRWFTYSGPPARRLRARADAPTHPPPPPTLSPTHHPPAHPQNRFARLWELDPAEMWGYVTNCGTEGNLHGILVGREVRARAAGAGRFKGGLGLGISL